MKMPTDVMARFHPRSWAPARKLSVAMLLLAAWSGLETSPSAQNLRRARGTARWRADFAAARAEAQQKQLPLLVCFNMDADEGNDRMADVVYRDPAVHKALEKVIPVLASIGVHGKGERCPRFGEGISCAQHQKIEKAARRFLFGEQLELIAAQHVILHPDGGVLWHEIYEIDARKLQSGVELASQLMKSRPEQRRCRNLTRIAELTKGRDDELDYQKARALLAHAEASQLKSLCDAIGRKELASRLIHDLARLYPDRAPALLAPLVTHSDKTMRAHGQAAIAEAQEILAKQGLPTLNAGPARQRITLPLPSLGKASELDTLTFADGRPRTLAEGSGKITLLWWFRVDDPSLARQVEEINRFARSLPIDSVRVLGCGASIAPETDAKLIGKLGLGFPAGAFRYDEHQPRDQIRWFPSTLVLDHALQVVYRTPQGQSVADLREFEDYVRALIPKPAGPGAGPRMTR